MNIHDIERGWAGRANRYLNMKLKRVDVSYEELAGRLNAEGWEESEASITDRLAKGTFDATFFLACLECLERDGEKMEDSGS